MCLCTRRAKPGMYTRPGGWTEPEAWGLWWLQGIAFCLGSLHPYGGSPVQHNQASQAEAIGSGRMGTCTPLLDFLWAWLHGLACLPACWGLALGWEEPGLGRQPAEMHAGNTQDSSRLCWCNLGGIFFFFSSDLSIAMAEQILLRLKWHLPGFLTAQFQNTLVKQGDLQKITRNWVIIEDRSKPKYRWHDFLLYI